MLRIRLFGHLEVAFDGRVAPFSALPKTTPLLAYLLLHRDRPIPRDYLAGLLWDDVRQGEALANLRRHLHDLRRALPPAPEASPWVVANHATLRWNPVAECWLDVAEFERLCGAPGGLAEAVTLYTGDLLPDVYEDWCQAERERMRECFLGSLARLVADCHTRGEDPAAIDYALHGLRQDPCHEPLGRMLVALRYANGDRAGAIQAYRALAERLRAELDVDPMPETQAVCRAVVDNAPADEVLVLAAGSFVPAVGIGEHRPATGLRAPAAGVRAPEAGTGEPHAETRALSRPPPSNLPAALTSFVGREAEIEAVCGMIGAIDAPVRLLTLTGPGGAGKTRLSQETGAQLAQGSAGVFPDGVFFVDLSALTQPDLVLPAIAETLGLVAGGGQRADALKALLAQKRMLLILDNFEQVVEAGPDMAMLLAGAPGLRLLVTSRAPLRVYGEHELPVPPLALPALRPLLSTSDLAEIASVALFVDRARALDPAFSLDPANAASVAELCVRFDGLPLAIELIAAHTKLFTPADLLARIAARPNALASRNRDTPARHRSLQDVVAWSYRLLDPPEQALFARLAVFAGGFSIDAAEAVIGEFGADAMIGEPDRGPIAGNTIMDPGAGPASVEPNTDVAAALALLLDHNLIRSLDSPKSAAGPRLGMLVILRDFALDQLDHRGEAETYRRRHADYFLDFAEQAAKAIHAAETRTAWLDRCDLEHDNLRAALAWAIEAREGETALRLAVALAEFWDVRGHLTEGRRWLDGAITSNPDANRSIRLDRDAAGPLAPDPEHNRGLASDSVAACSLLGIALRQAGSLALHQNDYAAARVLLQRSLDLAEAAGEPREIARSLHGLGLSHEGPGDLQTYVERALSIYRRLDDQTGIANCLQSLGALAGRRHDYHEAQAIYAQCLAIRRTLGETWAMDPVLNNLGVLAQALGDLDQAERLHREALERRRAAGFKQGIAQSLHNLGLVAYLKGDPDMAAGLYRESMALHWEVGALVGLAECLEGLAAVAAANREAGRAAELFGAVDGLVASLGIRSNSRWAPSAHVEQDVVIEDLRDVLGDERFAAAWEAGRALPPAEVVRREVAASGGEMSGLSRFALGSGRPNP